MALKIICSVLAIWVCFNLVVIRGKTEVTSTGERSHTEPDNSIAPPFRIDCIPHNPNSTEGVCKTHHSSCIYDENVVYEDAPQCYLDPGKFGYRVITKIPSDQSNKDVYHLAAIHDKKLYSTKFVQPRLVVERMSGTTLHMKFDDAAMSRYEVPVELQQIPYDDSFLYDVNIPKGETAIDQLFIARRHSETKIWDFGLGGLFLEQQFLQFTTKLPSNNCYGFGENLHDSFKHKFDWKTWAMFSRDEQPIYPKAQRNLYGVHPFYMCVEADGNAHGVFLLNSNAMEYKLLPAPALTLRSIGGVLDFYIFLGPTPENVVQQYTQLTGRTFIPPYWALGFQLSRWGFEDLTVVQNTVKRNVEQGVPLDVIYGDIDYMRHRQDFTVDQNKFSGLTEYITELHQKNMKSVIILDPGIHVDADRFHPTEPKYMPHEEAVVDDVYIKWPVNFSVIDPENSGPNRAMLGKVWPDGRVGFPDFFKSSTKSWWTRWINYTYNDLGIRFDSLWIDMNEVSSWDTNKRMHPPCYQIPKNENHSCTTLQCPENMWDDPPYKPAAARIYGSSVRLSDTTLCMVAEQDMDGVTYKQYDVHSLYGWSEGKVTYEAAQKIRGSRTFVLSRSTFPTGQRYVGHWLGDNASNFTDLRHSITGLLEFSLFGYAYVGADICGFNGNTTRRLCSLWSAAGAFYPFSRNHNVLGGNEQDPGKDPVVARFARLALTERYRLLPYLYTLFYRAHVYGDTVSRPLHHLYPSDSKSLETDTQFFWGDALMISPIVENVTARSVYIPSSEFYDYYDGSLINSTEVAFSIESSCFSETAHCWGPVVPLHLRGGRIIPIMDPGTTTEASRKNPLRLLITATSTEEKSSGELFWDDGVSIDTYENQKYYHAEFSYDNVAKILEWNTKIANMPVSDVPLLHELLIYSSDTPNPDDVFDVTVNGQDYSNNVKSNDSYKYLSVSLQPALQIMSSFRVQLRRKSSGHAPVMSYV